MRITKEKAYQLRTWIEKAISAMEMTDAEALECVELYPRWVINKAYEIKDMVNYNNLLYRCVQAHTSQDAWTPDVSVSLWDEVKINADTGYDEWQQPTGAHDAYNTGDRVVYMEQIYESLIDGNTYSPDAYPAGWQLVTE